MTIAIEAQALALAASLGIGAMLGLLYDLLRPFRLGASTCREWALDFLFWIVVTLTVFIFAPVLEDGQIRIYMLLGYFLGAVLYFCFVSKPVRTLCAVVARLWQRVVGLLLRPIRWIWSILKAPLATFFAQIRKKAKKLFSFVLQWFRIVKIRKQAASAARALSTRREESPYESQTVRNQKGWYSLEDCGVVSPDLHSVHAREHSGADQRHQ